MLKREYLLAMMQEIAKVLARMMGLKMQGKIHEALELAYHTMDSQFQLNAIQLAQHSPEMLLTYLVVEKECSEDTINSIAELLAEQGELEQSLQLPNNEKTMLHALYLLEWVDVKQQSTYSITRKNHMKHLQSLLSKTDM
jgi:hypothetical protein